MSRYLRLVVNLIPGPLPFIGIEDYVAGPARPRSRLVAPTTAARFAEAVFSAGLLDEASREYRQRLTRQTATGSAEPDLDGPVPPQVAVTEGSRSIGFAHGCCGPGPQQPGPHVAAVHRARRLTTNRRRTTMSETPQRQLGTGGPAVSAIGLGFMSFRTGTGPGDEKAAKAVVDAALDTGVTFFDTADVYGPQHSEILLGRALKGRRDQAFIATKFGNALDRTTNADHRIDGRPEYVRTAIEGSLRRLGVDHVDLYYQHRVDPTVPIEETVGALKELVEAGKVRHIGLSEAGPQTIRRAHAVHPIAAIQSEWSLFSRDIEETTVAVARELGIALVPFSPLGRAWLTGAVRSRDDIVGQRLQHPRFAEENFATNRALADEVVAVAAELGARPSQVALSWVLSRGDDVIPIPGTKNPAYVRENAGALSVRLSPEQSARLEKLAARVAGHRSIRPENLGTEAPLP